MASNSDSYMKCLAGIMSIMFLEYDLDSYYAYGEIAKV